MTKLANHFCFTSNFSVYQRSSSIKIMPQMSLLVTDVDKLNKRVGTVTDNEELWVKLSDVHHTFQRKVSICQRLVSPKKGTFKSYSSINLNGS